MKRKCINCGKNIEVADDTKSDGIICKECFDVGKK